MTMKHKRTGTAGKAPLVADLDDGQLAMNVADAILFMKKTVGGVSSVVRVGAEISPAVAPTLKAASLAAFRAAIGAAAPSDIPAVPGPSFSGEIAASGTQINIGSIPADTRRIILYMVGLRLAAGNAVQLQLGTASGIISSGYASVSGGIASSSGLSLRLTNSAYFAFSDLVAINAAATRWAFLGTALKEDGSGPEREAFGSGIAPDLAGSLASLRLSVSGTTFAAGTVLAAFHP